MFVNQKLDADSGKMLDHSVVEAMHSATYIEDYLDFVENVPDDIQRNITQLRELDLKYQEMLQEIDNFQNALKKDLDANSRKRTLYQVQRVLIQTQDIGDKKLQIMQIIQDIIDNKSRQLEMDQKKLDLGRENEAQNDNSKNDIQPERASKRSRRQRHVEITLRDDSGHERHEKEIPAPTTNKKQKKKKRKAKVEKEQEPTSIDPIDPDEPTYCLCDQVSYGEMIGCDNEDCEREWFHFSCVGLTTKPKGKWYCPTCRGDRSNQMKPKSLQ